MDENEKKDVTEQKVVTEKKSGNKRTLIIVIIAAIVVLIGVVCGFMSYINNMNTKQAQNSNMDGLVLDTRAEGLTEEQKALKEREVFFTGFEGSRLNHESKINLINLPENEDFLMKYICINSDTGETVYETDLIPSGQTVVWTPYNDLGVGTFTIKFTQVPYYMQENGEYRTLTSASNEVVLEIVD